MIQVQEAEVEDGADDCDIAEQQICASVRQLLVAVPLQWYCRTPDELVLPAAVAETISLEVRSLHILYVSTAVLFHGGH